MPEMSGTAIDIYKKYPNDQYIPLVPVVTLSQISPLHKMAINLGKISTDENDKDVYKQGDGLALTKKGLLKLMAAANIQVVEIRKVAPSSCEKCLEMARATGKPSACATCPNKSDVAYEATLSIPDPAGGFRLVKGSREFICEDERSKMTEAQYKQAFSFRGAMTESKAINRAIRAALMVKSSYKAAELSKTFVVPIVVPDASDPEMKAAIIERFRKGADMLYVVKQELPALPGKTDSAEGSDEDLDAAIDAEFNVAGALEPPTPFLICDECQSEIVAFKTPNKDWTVEEWVAYSKRKYNAQLCPKCARARGGAA
jgi:cytochrome c5